jgi:hypothetical protein
MVQKERELETCMEYPLTYILHNVVWPHRILLFELLIFSGKDLILGNPEDWKKGVLLPTSQ